MLSSNEGIILFAVYGLLVVVVVGTVGRIRGNRLDFLLMGRNLGVTAGAISMAVSWIWAPAIFVVSQKAYEQGIAGVFWFTLPNIVTFFVFAYFAVKLRGALPTGVRITDLFEHKFPDSKGAKFWSQVVAYGYQLGAIVINCVAGATLINLLSGISFEIGVLLMAGLALSYSLFSGLRASVSTDVLQMAMILVISCLIVPWVLLSSGGIDTMQAGIGGASGEFNSILSWEVAYSFGIASTLGLLAGPIADQMFTQRAFAARRDALVRIFVFGGLIFGVVPIVLSMLGFVGAGQALTEGYIAADPQMVGPEVVAMFLPKWALMLFAVMAFAGLTSTLDSAFTALGALSAESGDEGSLRRARTGMSLFAAIGIVIALMKPQLVWVFLIYGALASALFLPAFLALLWKRVSGLGVSLGIGVGVLIGTPLSIYGNVSNDVDFVVLGALVSVGIGGVVCILVSLMHESPKNLEQTRQ